MKHVLIIGASKTTDEDCARWNAFFSDKDTDWEGPKCYFTRDLCLKESEFKKFVQKTREERLTQLIDLYDQEYVHLISKNYSEQKFDCIMTDRATTHGLVIDNPFSPTAAEGWPEDDKTRFYDLIPTNNNNDFTNIKGTWGQFNIHILCLLFLRLTNVLKEGGDLIFDTFDLKPEHIELLKECFESSARWDTQQEDNVLKYDIAYGANTSAFICFSGFKNNVHTIDIKSRLLDIAFRNNQASAGPNSSSDPTQPLLRGKQPTVGFFNTLSTAKKRWCAPCCLL